MTADISYLPGSSAVLVFVDEHGIQRSCIVRVLKKNQRFTGTPWYVVIGDQETFSANHLAVPLERATIDVEEGKSLALVREDQLSPVGTRAFHIVQ